MEELFELRNHIEQGRYDDALLLLGEMEEMSRDDKINKIESFLVILLIHLIKRSAEKRSTNSWERSIFNSVQEICVSNKRRKSGGYYLSEEELKIAVDEVYQRALINASYEAFEGRLSVAELAKKIHGEQIKEEALQLVLTARNE